LEDNFGQYADAQNKNSVVQQAKQTTQALLQRAGDYFGVKLPAVDIRFDLRGKAAGMVRFSNTNIPIIRYNRAMLEKHRDNFLRQTVPHEVSHVVVATLYRHRAAPHGAEWQSVMAFFGAEPRRCHQFPVDNESARRLALFSYKCACREHQLTTIRHNRIMSGQRYYCRNCGEFLLPSSVS